MAAHRPLARLPCWSAPIAHALLLAVLLSASQAAAQERTLQLTEDSAVSHAIAPAAPTQVCEAGAHWIRLGFASLVLAPGDSLVLSSSGGDQLRFGDSRWNGRSFHARALRGECVDIAAAFSGDSHYQVDGYDAGSADLQDSPITTAGAGDICTPDTLGCRRTSDLIVAMNPSAVFTTGDNAYYEGTLDQFNAYYDPNWGRFKALTLPSPGNHEYNGDGYFDYFNGVGNQTGIAGDRSEGYYSYDIGEWHFIALNSRAGGTVSAAQLAWLDADLAANTKPCTAAYFHYPLVSRGNYTGYPTVKPFYDRLYAAKADLVLVGHDHNYQRYGKMDSFQVATTDGLRQVIVGTGGAGVYPINGTHPLLEASNSGTFGVLRLDLTAMGYDATFLPRAGRTYSDHFSASCNNGPRLSPDFTVSVATSPLVVVRGGSVTQAVTVSSGGGFTSPVRLTVSGLPAGTSYSVSPNPVTPSANGQANATLTLRATTTTYTGTLTIKVKGTSDSTVRTTDFRLTFR
jgi:acid phosphatase type 7